MSIVYLLYHIYEYGDENEHEELKTLGIYSSEAKAKAAIQYYKDLSGFSKYPLSCFVIDSYRVDANAEWRGGFCNVDDIYSDLDNLAQCFTEWTEGRYTLFEDVYNSPLLNDVYSLSCQERNPKALTDRLQEIWHKYFPQIRYKKDDFLYLADKIISTISGKTNKADKDEGTFQTTSPVRAITKESEHFACLCKGGSVQQVQNALHAGTDINAKNEFGRTALTWAARDNTNPEVLKLLLDAGADVRAKDEEGRTALTWAARDNTNPEVLKLLLDAGADIRAKDEEGRTALMWAARDNTNPEVLKLLLENGADIRAKDEEGRTALTWAARDNTNPEVLKLLLDAGADIWAKDEEGRTALMWAAQDNTNPEVVRVLLEAGTDANIKDNKGSTALMLAAKWNSDGVVNTLLDSGADIAIKDDEEKQAADYAQENKKLQSTDTLRRLWGICW